MNAKTTTLMVLAALSLTVTAAAREAGPAQQLAPAAPVSAPAIASPEIGLRPTSPTLRDSTATALAKPLSVPTRKATGETSVGGLQALKWIYDVVTCHDSSTCEAHTRGVQVGFSAPY